MVYKIKSKDNYTFKNCICGVIIKWTLIGVKFHGRFTKFHGLGSNKMHQPHLMDQRNADTWQNLAKKDLATTCV